MSGVRLNLVRLCIAFAALLGPVALVSCSSQEQAPPPSPTQESVPPFESEDGFAWITAACGSPSVMNGAPNRWMPEALDVKLCLTPIDRPGVIVGVYDNPSVSAADLAKIRGQHGYATRQDDAGRQWVFMVESPDAAPLAPLQRYGFELS